MRLLPPFLAFVAGKGGSLLPKVKRIINTTISREKFTSDFNSCLIATEHYIK